MWCYTLQRQRRNILSFVRRAYGSYFEIAVGDQDKKWAPHIVCHNCEEMLRDWTKGKRNGMPFGVPWFGVNRRTTAVTAISAWSIPSVSARKTGIVLHLSLIHI